MHPVIRIPTGLCRSAKRKSCRVQRSRFRRLRRSRCRGLTLIEATVASAIVAISFAACAALLGSASQNTRVGMKMLQADSLAQSIREWTLTLPFEDPDSADAGRPPGPDPFDPAGSADDLDDLRNRTFGPPVDGQGNVLSGLEHWEQRISVKWVDPLDLTAVPDGTSDTVLVSVQVCYQSSPMFTADWLVYWR